METFKSTKVSFVFFYINVKKELLNGSWIRVLHSYQMTPHQLDPKCLRCAHPKAYKPQTLHILITKKPAEADFFKLSEFIEFSVSAYP